MKARRFLAWVVTALLLLTSFTLPAPLGGAREAEALNCTYNPTLAISKAPEILDKAVAGGWGGATYVDKVLRAGGLNLGSKTLSGAGDLLDYLNTPSKFGGSIGQVIVNPTGNQLHKGDVLTIVCYKGGNSSNYTNGHSKGAGKYYGLQTCIVSQVVSNTQVKYYQAHNERRNATLTLSTHAKGFTCSKCGNNTYVRLVAFCFNDTVKQYPITVSFSANGGSVSTTSKTVYYNTTYGSLPSPTRSGYSFDGWYTAASGGSYVTSSTKVTATGNHTLYAHWNAAYPSITAHPSSKTVNEGMTATFNVVASNATSYQWQYKKPNESTWNNVMSNGTSATYTLTTAARHTGYTYRCKVSNAAGSVYSNTATLTVRPKPVISTHPASKTVSEGAIATFKVVATGATAYQWQYRKPNESTWNNVVSNGTSATYSLTAAARHNGYTYRCKVSNAVGSVYSNTATLTVGTPSSKPTITTQPASKTVNEGKTVTFKLVATGATAYQWQYRKPNESTWNNVMSNGTSATYSLTTAARHNGYVYRCKVSNAAGSVYSNTATLTVNAIKYRALLIGEDDYLLPDDCLDGSINNMNAMAGMLRGLTNSFSTTTLPNSTKSQIMNAISSTFAGATENDVSLFYYAGHGVGPEDPEDADLSDSYLGALCPIDYYDNGTYNNLIKSSELASALSTVKGRVIVILDCCHGGACIGKSYSQRNAALKQYNDAIISAFSKYKMRASESQITSKSYELAKSKFIVITATSYSENGWQWYFDGSGYYQGCFTAAFIKGMGCTYPNGSYSGSMPADNNPSDKLITLGEIYEYSRSLAFSWTSDYCDSTQNAQYYGNVNEVLFRRK